MSLTGLKDTDRLVLQYLDDRELLRICSVDRKTWNEVCNDDFLKRRLSKYPSISKYKNKDETWKQFFFRAIYYIAKLKENFEFQYTEGDFQQYFEILNDYEGSKLLDMAAEIGSLGLIEYSLKQGLIISPHTLKSSVEGGHLETVKFLVERGGGIHGVDDLALRIASRKGYLEIVKFLVGNGADVHAREDEALRVASERGHLEIVKFLAENGANIHAREDEALRHASIVGSLSVVKYLVENGANVHANEDKPLRGASERGHLKIVKFLVENGADIHAKKDAATRLAKKNGHVLTVRCLENIRPTKEQRRKK